MRRPKARQVDEGIANSGGTGQEHLCATEVTQDPVLLEPADVPDLPDGRLEEVSLLTEQLRVGNALENLQLDVARVIERGEQVSRCRSLEVHGCTGPTTGTL